MLEGDYMKFKAARLTVLSLTILCGCSTNDVNQKQAQEIALEDAGFDSSNVSDLKTQLKSKIYTVTFVANDIVYHYEVDEDGTILEFHTHSQKSKDTENQNQSDQKEEKADKEDSKADSNSKEKQEEATQIALEYTNISADNAADLNTQYIPSTNQYVVSFDSGDLNYSIVVDSSSQNVISAIIQ